MATIRSIYRYPVKGLSPEALPRIALAPGETVPGDRLYAIENGPSGFDPSAPAYLSKQHFLMLMKNERLAALRTAFDQTSHVLRIQDGEREAARGDLRTDKGRARIENFFAASFADELRGAPKILHANGHSFSDAPLTALSLTSRAREGRADPARSVSRPNPVRGERSIMSPPRRRWCGRRGRAQRASATGSSTTARQIRRTSSLPR
jgi:hypothetical protein